MDRRAAERRRSRTEFTELTELEKPLNGKSNSRNSVNSVLDPASSRAGGENDWLLWQLADSAFPTGGFAHSAGLEAAWQHGEVRNRTELVSFLKASLHQLGRAAVPLVAAAWDEPERLPQFDQLCDAFTTNHVANRASRLQGKAFLAARERIFKSAIHERPLTTAAKAENGQPPFAHYAPVFGSCLRRLTVPRETALRLFIFNHLRSAFAAAVRLNIIGPMEAQTLQHQLAPFAETILEQCQSLTLDDLAQTAPLLDLWQTAHDRLYSRLFQS
jgi:urease accessory protein